MPIISADLNCEACNYCLRGLDAASVCPECGAPIERSLRPDRLSFEDPSRLRRVSNGLMLTLLAFLMIAVVVLVIIVGRMALPGWMWGIAAVTGWITFAARLSLPIGVILTALDPAKVQESPQKALFRIFSILFSLLHMVSTFGNSILIARKQWPPWAQANWRTIGLISPFLTWALLSCFAFHLCALARSVPNMAAERMAWLIGACYSLCAVWILLDIGRALPQRDWEDNGRNIAICIATVLLVWIIWKVYMDFRRAARNHIEFKALLVAE